MKRVVCAAILLLYATAPSRAEEPADRPAQPIGWYGAEYQACSAKTSTPEIAGCINDLAAKWDHRLNAAYQALMAGQTPDQRERLRIAERGWLQFRNANCDFYLNVQGTIANIKYAECRRVLTAQRTIELETEARP